MPIPQTPPLAYPAEQVWRDDRDRFVTALFAPPDRREALYALYAFHLEVAKVPELVREPMMGQIRLQWWRDSLNALLSGGAVAHPVAGPLAEAIHRFDLPPDRLEHLIDAREADLTGEPPETLAAMEDYARATAATLNELALDILGVHQAAAREAGREVGIAWGLTGLLRAVPFHAAGGRLHLPRSLLARHRVPEESVRGGLGAPGLPAVAAEIAATARAHLAAARRHRREVPRAALPALLPAVLADGYLRRLRRSGYDLFAADWATTRTRPLRLTIAAAFGRY